VAVVQLSPNWISSFGTQSLHARLEQGGLVPKIEAFLVWQNDEGDQALRAFRDMDLPGRRRMGCKIAL
jgi:hypothetical protein